MTAQRLIPTRDHLTAVVEKTERFLEYLRDAGLIESDETPPIPESSVAYRKSHAVQKWSEWERIMNPTNTFFGAPPTEIVAGGWKDWNSLHYILVDIHALRSELITKWGLMLVVGAASVRLSYEAIGVPGSGEKAIFITGENDPSNGPPRPVRLEKPLEWPPPVSREWRNQCRYAIDRIKALMDAEGTCSSHPEPDGKSSSNAGVLPTGAKKSWHSDVEFVNEALRALTELINACADFHLAGTEQRRVASVQFEPFQIVKACVARMTEFATSRLDNLCIKHLQTRPGQWSVELLEIVMDPIRLDSGNEYVNALRARYNQLSKLGIILENDARDDRGISASTKSDTAKDPVLAAESVTQRRIGAVGATSSGLMYLDLTAVFRFAIELAEAVATVPPDDWAGLPVNIEGPQSPHFARWIEWGNRMSRIEEETVRVKRILGASGPMTLEDRIAAAGWENHEAAPPVVWECFEKKFLNTAHDRVVRLALTKIATGVIELSGFATWREPQWDMRENGLTLLKWGLAQLWEGLTQLERSAVGERLARTQKAIGWPIDASSLVPPYDGPEEIPLEYQYRTLAPDRGYVACYRGYVQDVEKAINLQSQKLQEKALRRWTIAQFVELAERAVQAIQALAKRDYDTTKEWADFHQGAINSLACLRRAKEVGPVTQWPGEAGEDRNLIADSAEVLLRWIGGDAETKKAMKLEDAEKAFETFKMATENLRRIAISDSCRSELQVVAEIPKPVHFGIITVKEEEFKAVEKRFDHLRQVHGPHRSYLHGETKGLDGRKKYVLIARCLEQAQSDAQQCTGDMIRDGDPEWILFVGIAGALPVEEHSLGDVLLASRVYDFAMTAAIEGGTVEQSPKGGGVHPEVSKLLQILPSEYCQKKLGEWNSANSVFIQKPAIDIPERLNAQAYYGSKEWKKRVKSSLLANFPANSVVRLPLFRIGSAATGNTLVKDSGLASEWKEAARSIDHIEMELGGAYVEAHRMHKPLLSIRGISDVVGFRRGSEWTNYACHTAASFTHALITSGLIVLKAS